MKPDRNETIVRMAAAGASYTQIGVALHCSRSVISGVLNRARERGEMAPSETIAQDRITAVVRAVAAGRPRDAVARELGLSLHQVHYVCRRHWPADVARPERRKGPARRESAEETEVLRLAGDGASRAQIALALGLSEGRVGHILRTRWPENTPRPARPAKAACSRPAEPAIALPPPVVGTGKTDGWGLVRRLEARMHAVDALVPGRPETGPSILSIRTSACHWPVAWDETAPFGERQRFCGAPARPGHAYCRHHRALSIAPAGARGVA